MVAARPCVTCQQPAFGMQCRSCRISAGRVPDESDALTGGAWVPRDGIMRWEARPEPPAYLFPEDERRDAHRRFWLGDREPSTIAGEREYQRHMKARARQAKRAMSREAS